MSVFSAKRLENKTVLVTGASAGIGEATAILFAKVSDLRIELANTSWSSQSGQQAGANVIITARRQEALSNVLELLKSAHREAQVGAGGKFAAVTLDVSNREEVKNLWTKVPEDLREVDILVNNAGFVKGVEKVGEISDHDIDDMIATNVIGLISVTQLLVKDFKARGTGTRSSIDPFQNFTFDSQVISSILGLLLDENRTREAAEWGLENPLWKGRIRVIEKESSGVVILLEDGQTGAPFARAPYSDQSTVQPVLDSSRYFVLRVQDPNTGSKAYIGIGFTDRAESFDFSGCLASVLIKDLMVIVIDVALQDYIKRKNAPAKLEEAATTSTAPKVDYSLKEGQTFRINIPGKKTSGTSSPAPAQSSASTSSGGPIPLLPPPPGGLRK
ncbi:hypothetical protein FRC15_010470 [Serendipita sp. 397]|nr:hypothetical protein FRC15_010470 [Serendipita sp. 397]